MSESCLQVGFTGTRRGTTLEQRNVLSSMFEALDPDVDVFRHGDCVGADEEAHLLAVAHGIFTVAHPPIDPKLRAYVSADRILAGRPYLDRNRDIVDMSDQLWACPGDGPATGGTWFTIRYAVSNRKPTCIVWPDGSWEWR